MIAKRDAAAHVCIIWPTNVQELGLRLLKIRSDRLKSKTRLRTVQFMKATLPQGSGVEDMTLFTEVTEKTELVVVANTIEKCMISKEKHQVLIDCACPTTVAGVDWIKSFISKLNEKERKMVKVKKSARIYKFGGGEKRNSL